METSRRLLRKISEEERWDRQKVDRLTEDTKTLRIVSGDSIYNSLGIWVRYQYLF